jgi:hypothetical protein
MKDQTIRYLKDIQVSEMTEIAVQTLRNQRACKKMDGIPYIRLGKKMIRYDIRDVISYMEAHKVK